MLNGLRVGCKRKGDQRSCGAQTQRGGPGGGSKKKGEHTVRVSSEKKKVGVLPSAESTRVESQREGEKRKL